MPSYKVIAQGFDGKMYDPDGPRNVLIRDEPFPKGKDGKEQVPSWLEAIAAETPAQAKKRKAAEKKREAAAAKKAAEDKAEIKGASFLGAGETSSTVETL